MTYVIQSYKLLLQLSLEFEAITNEFGCTTYLDWKTPKYVLLSYRKLKPHESQVRPQQSFCNRDILFNFFPTRQRTHKSYSELTATPQCVKVISYEAFLFCCPNVFKN